MLDVGYWILDIGCWMLDAGYLFIIAVLKEDFFKFNGGNKDVWRFYSFFHSEY